MAAQRRRPSQPYSIHYVRSERTPIPQMQPPVAYVGEGENRHMDVEETIRMLAVNVERLTATISPEGLPPLDEASISSYEKKFERASKWGGWIWGVVAIFSLVFSAGVAYAIFLGENATDAEVEAADKAMIIDHNGGIDPAVIDDETHKPVGDHPDMRKAIKVNTETARAIKEDILPPMVETQKKLDKRSEYQYELTIWEAKKSEARRKRRPIPPKGNRLETLEKELLRGDYN